MTDVIRPYVLIESDWNLKYAAATVFAVVTAVLIESDWNLKFIICIRLKNRNFVLIESDWNLKSVRRWRGRKRGCSINRIRLEFKDKMGTNIQDIQNAY